VLYRMYTEILPYLRVVHSIKMLKGQLTKLIERLRSTEINF